jgi:hypothetical protein
VSPVLTISDTSEQPAAKSVTPPASTEQPAAGRYLVDGRIYQIVHTIPGGWRVQRIRRRDKTAVAAYTPARGLRIWHPGAEADVELILADPTATAAAYARGTGHCSRCDRLLTAPASATRGLGPDCAAVVS